jgi:mono/diheme cytochrome c family protein
VEGLRPAARGRARKTVVRPILAALLLAACNRALPPREPTYHSDIEPLFAVHCRSCHQPNGINPVPSLLDYESVRTYAEPIRLFTQARVMPPWAADNSGECGTWVDAHWLSDAQIATISDWIDKGLPEGAPDIISGASTFVTPFHSDGQIDIGGTYRPGVGAGGNRCFLADPHLDRDRLLTAIRVASDDARGVAQLTLFALDSAAAEAEAAALDEAEPGLGYGCFGTARVNDARLVASWTWPEPILRLPAGTGVRLHAGRQLVIQVHYDVARTSSSFVSGTQVELELDDRVTEARVVAVSAEGPLPPGLKSTSVESIGAPAGSMRMVGVAPRMHIRGRNLRLEVEHEGETTCLARFPNWDFYNQQVFRAARPTRIEAADHLRISCEYVTLGRTEPVAFGDAIDDEECVAYLFVTD